MKVLLVEDSPRLQRSISTGLKSRGYSVDQAFDGQEALNFSETYAYDVIILDLMLPKVDGLSILRMLRQRKDNTSVLILSAMDQTEDRILGLDLGADDYLVKPFAFDELVSRIRALIRRSVCTRVPSIEVGELTIDTVSREAAYCGQVLPLTPSEFALLECLAQYRGIVFSHQQLIDRLHESGTEVTKNAVEVHICTIRKKLASYGCQGVIKTRRGFGYLIEKS